MAGPSRTAKDFELEPHNAARAQEVETDMDMACERAAIGSTPYAATRDTWNKQAWG